MTVVIFFCRIRTKTHDHVRTIYRFFVFGIFSGSGRFLSSRNTVLWKWRLQPCNADLPLLLSTADWVLHGWMLWKHRLQGQCDLQTRLLRPGWLNMWPLSVEVDWAQLRERDVMLSVVSLQAWHLRQVPDEMWLWSWLGGWHVRPVVMQGEMHLRSMPKRPNEVRVLRKLLQPGKWLWQVNWTDCELYP